MLVVLCISQITSWGVRYYAFPVMLVSVTATTGWTTGTALSAFSTGLLASAVAAPLVGRLIDRHGPRPVMTVGSVGCCLAARRAGRHRAAVVLRRLDLVGLAQSAVHYPPAFAALTGWYGQRRRVCAITTVTLVGGLASTVFAPITAALLTARVAVLAIGAATVAVLGSLTGPTAALIAAAICAGAARGVFTLLLGSYTLAYYLLAAFAIAGALMAVGTTPAPRATAG